MIGLGVGIDYALFIVTRYRQGLHEGRDPREATIVALTTSGRAVLFAGGTVIISLLGLFVVGLAFMNGLAVGTIAAVLMVLAAALTLLPAMLGFVGHNIDRLHVPGLLVRAPTAGRGFWYRWSRTVQRRPWVCGTAALAVLLVLALPLFSMRLAFSDAGNDPTKLTTRQAYDLLASGFGPGFNGPLVIAADLTRPASALSAGRAAVEALDTRLAQRARGGVRRSRAVQPDRRRRGHHRLPDHLAAGGPDRFTRPAPAQHRHPAGGSRHGRHGAGGRGDCRRDRRLALSL